ncbi:MAG: RecX family transcriptional regulator [Actinobacteria bacterium]|nr:RecX family transcriptional regulator [Actinomycetota bacterium]MCG2817928.1 RecX family transcriptional regulator [Actinomycetes bacterium]MBU4219106.1 RecX family transcriptional regulator [Actinomycetota bacterium]MBU4358393.1 RecX family transcriptional regulator [Actinomycetota bacterium]MBU4391049.1 RecX family transcriptional regulator [Actinomycetota bacterium]
MIDEVIAYLQSKGIIDDLLFTELFMEEMLRKGFGCRRVRSGLKKKKLDIELVEEAMSGYPLNQEAERARTIAAVRVSRMANEEPAKRKTKIMHYLIRQGYSPEVADEVSRSVVIDTQTGREYN